jgi:hypothetical protein
MGTRLSETELQKSLDFCVNLFNPTTPEQHQRVKQLGQSRLGATALKKLMDVTAPIVDPLVLEGALRVEMKVGVADGNLKAIVDSLAAFSLPMQRYRSLSTCSITSEDEKEAETRMVLSKINARRVVQSEYEINNLESEPLNGYVVRLVRGKLGLKVAGVEN